MARVMDYPCETCDQQPGQKHRPTVPAPDIEELEEMADGIAQATDGCEVEPDGRCEHGHPSWLLAYGLI